MKKIIKKILGEKVIQIIKSIVLYIKSIPKIITKNIIITNKKMVKEIQIYELKNKNVFCGYYDLEPIKQNKMLVHVCDKNANTKDKIELGYFNIEDGKYKKIAETNAWCWQQGSRLRWSNKEKNIIYFNDVTNESYCCKKYDIKNNKIVKEIPYPIYDIDKEEKYGITVNFSRLQRLRPGYGYEKLEDKTKGEKAPINDGIFMINLNDNTCNKLISLRELSELVDKDLKYEHYINHISISPKGDKIMFFHLWTEKTNNFQWKNQLCTINIDGSDLKILENIDLVSHYDWKNDEGLLITGIKLENGREFYRYYNIENGQKEDIEDINLTQDGHPIHTENKNTFYSDTYPNSNSMQKVFEYNLENKKYNWILEIFSNPMLFSEKRCDLHPKLVRGKDEILIDSTLKNKKRSVILIKLKDRE